MSSDSKEDVIAQIRRVMRLADRAGTEGEKAAADAAMLRLANKHGINLDDVKATDSDIKISSFLEEEFHVLPMREFGYVSAVLREHFGIIPIQHRSGRKVQIQWIGTRINVEIAKHVSVILLRSVQRDWRQALIGKKLAKAAVSGGHIGLFSVEKTDALIALVNLDKRAFLDGWFWTIHQKLREFPLRNDKEQFEAERKAAEDMLEKMKRESQDIKENKHRKRNLSTLERKSAQMGYEAAQAVNLSRPCEGNGYQGSPFAIGMK